MKSLNTFLTEAKNPKPSALHKFKKGSREVQNEYIAGDVYDLSGNNRYTQTDSYYQGDGDGYIMDKAGNAYDVVCSEGTGDAGRIAGGSSHKRVTIKKAGPDGKDLRFSGYSAVFSRPSSDTFYTLITDIEAGCYLEDYLVRHKDDLGDYNLIKSDWFKEKTKDADGKSLKDRKREKTINAEETFNQRYCVIREIITFYDDGKQNLRFTGAWGNWAIAYIKPSSTKNKGKGGMFSSEKAEPDIKVPQDVNDEIIEAFRKLAVDVINNTFKGADTAGINFDFAIAFEGKEKYGGPSFGWDIKKKRFVVIDLEKRKVLDRVFELRLSKITIDIDEHCSEFVIKLKQDACKVHVKALGSESKYVADNYKAVQWGKGYWKPEMKAGEAKQVCKDQFASLKRGASYNAGKKIEVFPATISGILGGKGYEKFIAKDKSTADNTPQPDEIQEITNGPEKPSSTGGKSAEETYGKAYGPAKEKMEKWHAGTRKQNLKNCNDGKLRMNFAICKELGYEEEMKAIQAEAKKRGIILESKLGLSDFIQAIFS